MVEKITINPTKVRGYGNIMNVHSSTDYDAYMSSISTGTDTVNGQTMTVYEMTDTIVFRDKGTTNDHEDIWTLSHFTLTRGDKYSTLLKGTSTSTCLLNTSHKISPTQTIEFDICQMYGSNVAIIYIRNDGSTSSLAQYNLSDLGASLEEWVHVKIAFNGTDTIILYSDKLSEPIYKNITTSTNYRLMLNGYGNVTELRFKNVIVYPTNRELGVMFYDKCTGGTSRWVSLNEYVTISSNSNGLTLTGTSSTSYAVFANKYNTSTSEYDYTGDFQVDFDIVDSSVANNGAATIQIYSNGSTDYYNKSLGVLGVTEPCHIKVVKKDNIFRTYIDGVENVEQRFSSDIGSDEACRVGFRGYQNWSITIKDFKIEEL